MQFKHSSQLITLPVALLRGNRSPAPPLIKVGTKGVIKFVIVFVFCILTGCKKSEKAEKAPDFLCPFIDVLKAVSSPSQSTGEPIVPSTLASGCPAEYTDGAPQPFDINVRSCHTQLIECEQSESAVDCGKRALMSGDWERAVQAFDSADDSCDAFYGRYLSRLFRLYANYNNLFFSDVIQKDYNKNHLTRDLNVPVNPESYHYYRHYACLTNEFYSDSDLTNSSLIDYYLELIWENRCELRGQGSIKDGLLPIRWIQGRCEAPLMDIVLVGRWDRVDAVLMYQWLMGSPAETKRFINIFGLSNGEECDNPICEPLIIDGKEIVRLPADSEWFLKMVRKSSSELFNTERSKWGVFYWEDKNDNSQIDASDAVLARLCNPITGNPTLKLEGATIGALWNYSKAPAPENPAPRRMNIFCGGTGACELLPGEIPLSEPEPLWLQLSLQPSPDGTQLAFLKESSPGIWNIYVTNNALDAEGNPECPSANYKDCCVTCAELPEGISLSSSVPGMPGATPDWIPDPNNPSGPALGLLFMHNEHPSSWGWGGQGHNGQYIALRPDGSAFSRLLPDDVPSAMHYQHHISPDGSRLFWTSTWSPETGDVGPHNLLIGTIVYDSQAIAFRLENIHSVLPGLDHGWYEAHDFAPDYPQDRRIFFTSSSHSMQSPRGFMATMDENDRILEVFKLTWPDEDPEGSFMVDYHPAWNEHFFPVDHAKQVLFVNSDGSGSAAERYDWYLNFPPYFEGVLFGLTIYTVRWVGFGNTGYLSLTPELFHWISNIDGTNREVLFKASLDAGWKTTGKMKYKDRVYFIQRHKNTGEFRYGYMDFP